MNEMEIILKQWNVSKELIPKLDKILKEVNNKCETKDINKLLDTKADWDEINEVLQKLQLKMNGKVSKKLIQKILDE